MSKIDSSFASAVEGRRRQLFVELLRQNLHLTLADLNQMAKGQLASLLGSVTVQDLMHPGHAAQPRHEAAARGKKGAKAVAKSPAPARAAEAKPAKGKASAGPADEVNTRTPAGRAAFDEAVFAAIQSIGAPVGAGLIQKQVGGTNMQVRSACNRLIEAGRVTWTGKARGTRYTAV